MARPRSVSPRSTSDRASDKDLFDTKRPSTQRKPANKKKPVVKTKSVDTVDTVDDITDEVKKIIKDKPVIKVETNAFMFNEKEQEVLKYECTCCRQKKEVSDFYSSMSLATVGRQMMFLCKDCIEPLWEAYYKRFSGEQERALYYFCMLIDLPFYKNLAEEAKNIQTNKKSYIANYISKTISFCRISGAGTFIDGQIVWDGRNDKDPNFFEIDPEETTFKPTVIDQRFWGNIPVKDMFYLKNQYEDWCKRYEVRDKAMEELVQQLCFKKLRLTRLNESGGANSKELKDYQDLMASANLKPKDNKGIGVDDDSLGVWIKKFEMDKPIPKVDPVYADVDGIGKKIRIWFLGHFAKINNSDNEFSKEYEMEMSKYRVNTTEEYETRSSRNLIGGEMFDATSE